MLTELTSDNLFIEKTLNYLKDKTLKGNVDGTKSNNLFIEKTLNYL